MPNEQTIEILEALLLALERREEVAVVITSSDDADAALRRVQDVLGISEIAASEVLNMQWRRWTRHERDGLRSRRDELLALRGDLPDPG